MKPVTNTEVTKFWLYDVFWFFIAAFLVQESNAVVFSTCTLWCSSDDLLNVMTVLGVYCTCAALHRKVFWAILFRTMTDTKPHRSYLQLFGLPEQLDFPCYFLCCLFFSCE